mgnify:CR=1 FL=1
MNALFMVRLGSFEELGKDRTLNVLFRFDWAPKELVRSDQLLPFFTG